MKLLIVEDERELSESIVCFLRHEDYLCEQAFTYDEAMLRVAVYEYDCVLLDLMLPDGTGLDVLRKVKRVAPQTGVIIVSAKDSLDDKVEGLRLGADDYLPKPFHLPELSMRIFALLLLVGQSAAGGARVAHAVVGHHTPEGIGHPRLQSFGHCVVAVYPYAGDKFVVVDMCHEQVKILGRGLQVSIHIAHQFGCGGFYPGIERGTQSPILCQREIEESGMSATEVADAHQALVGRPVVYHQHTCSLPGLRQIERESVFKRGNVVFLIVNGYNDGQSVIACLVHIVCLF